MVVWFVIPVAVIITATLSGIFGMGGGLLLMAIYVLLLPVSSAMVLHGITQLVSNGFRCFLLRKHIHWPVIPYYVGGALVSVMLVWVTTLSLNKPATLLALGLIPSLNFVPKLPALDFMKPRHAFSCGIIVAGAQMTAGVSGALLDVFFLKTPLNRHQVVATKALTQSMGHLAKTLYFGSLLSAGSGEGIPIWVVPVVIISAMAGTAVGRAILEKLSETGFRKASTALVTAIGTVCLIRAWMLW